MFTKFDNLFKRIIVEEFDLRSFEINDKRFKFKRDGDNIFCRFLINQNAKQYIVIASYKNNKLMFSVTGEDGTNSLYTEREFAAKYHLDYDDFMKDFEVYKNHSDSFSEFKNGSNVNNFMDVLQNRHKINGVKDAEIFKINGINFLFHMLNDELVENYCECIFQFSDDTTSEVFFYKVLIMLKESNSVIIKILIFNEKGDLLDTITASDFQKRENDVYDSLLKAINEMSAKIYK